MLNRLNGSKAQQDETDQQEIDLTQYVAESEIENYKMSYGAQAITEKQKEVERLQNEIESINELNAYDMRVDKAKKLVTNVLGLVWNDETQKLFYFDNEYLFSQSYQVVASFKQYTEPAAGLGDAKKPSQASNKEFGKQLARKTNRGRK